MPGDSGFRAVVTRSVTSPGLILLLAFNLGAWLLTGQLLGARRGGALDRGPDHREDRTLQRGGGKDLTPASPGINGPRRLVMARREPHTFLTIAEASMPPSRPTSKPKALYCILLICCAYPDTAAP
jgi:hypothetical protein